MVCPGPVVSEIGSNAYNGNNNKDFKPSSKDEDKAKVHIVSKDFLKSFVVDDVVDVVDVVDGSRCQRSAALT